MTSPWTNAAPGALTVEEVRARVHRELGDLLDVLSVLPAEYADWPTPDQLAALREARQHIAEAREALNRAG